jgi:2,3-bisphosphoglycerate-independent phosphoglycerate mutase
MADKPNLEWIASQDYFGIHDLMQQRLACGSDTAQISIFDCDPIKLCDGRESFQAMGSR